MNIEEINKKHLLSTDMYFRVGQGLSSQLLKYEHGILYLEIEIRTKWKKSVDAAAYTVAYSWKNEHEELCEAIASKVFIINSKEYGYKRTLIHLGITPGYDEYKGVFFK
ncbi:MAG: hypothetical protein V3V00_00220 [Saprospiraceae bacterium]